jgi:hypothetical protein
VKISNGLFGSAIFLSVFSAFRLVPMGIFAGVPFMGIQGFIPGPELIVRALTPGKIPQLRMEIHSNALSWEFFSNLVAGQNPESMNCIIPCLVGEICNSGTQIPAGTLLRPSRIKIPEIPVGFRFRH